MIPPCSAALHARCSSVYSASARNSQSRHTINMETISNTKLLDCILAYVAEITATMVTMVTERVINGGTNEGRLTYSIKLHSVNRC